MMRLERIDFGGMLGEVIVAELTTPESALLERDAARLHEAERTLATTFKSAARRDAFLAGRLAVHSALQAAGDGRAHRMPVLRDPRGRPAPAWADAAPLSIAHTRIRAMAAVAATRACTAIGVDVEEILPERANALLRMAISQDERNALLRVDPQLLAAPIALWCAREACVKAHALEVGWFGSALRMTAMTPCTPSAPDADAGFDIEMCFESRPPMLAHAWCGNGAAYAIACR